MNQSNSENLWLNDFIKKSLDIFSNSDDLNKNRNEIKNLITSLVNDNRVRECDNYDFSKQGDIYDHTRHPCMTFMPKSGKCLNCGTNTTFDDGVMISSNQYKYLDTCSNYSVYYASVCSNKDCKCLSHMFLTLFEFVKTGRLEIYLEKNHHIIPRTNIQENPTLASSCKMILYINDSNHTSRVLCEWTENDQESMKAPRLKTFIDSNPTIKLSPGYDSSDEKLLFDSVLSKIKY